MTANGQERSGRTATGLVIAAPHSGSGKTTLTIALLRALARRGVLLSPAKIGPDYIDPQFHQIASGAVSINVDGWAMGERGLQALKSRLALQGDFALVEGVMGLFDGAVKPGVLGHGATADVAKALGLPVVLVVDCAGMGQSVAALVQGFQSYDRGINLAGVILNKLGSLRHVEMMKGALEALGVDVIGAVPRSDQMALPSRHLGLVQASEQSALDRQLDEMADWVEAHVSLEKLMAAAGPMSHASEWPLFEDAARAGPGFLPPGRHVAVARDDAFRFFYPHIADCWRAHDVSLSFFSPIADEAPARHAEAVFLPGGYPELHAGRLAANQTFMGGLRAAARQGKPIYGECGGYMVLGEGLVDAEGGAHEMAGLLKLETSFQERKLHLGYRHIRRTDGAVFRGHEFHYSTILKETGAPLFRDVNGAGGYGLLDGVVSGSYIHIIDQVDG